MEIFRRLRERLIERVWKSKPEDRKNMLFFHSKYSITVLVKRDSDYYSFFRVYNKRGKYLYSLPYEGLENIKHITSIISVYDIIDAILRKHPHIGKCELLKEIISDHEKGYTNFRSIFVKKWSDEMLDLYPYEDERERRNIYFLDLNGKVWSLQEEASIGKYIDDDDRFIIIQDENWDNNDNNTDVEIIVLPTNLKYIQEIKKDLADSFVGSDSIE